MNLIKYGHILGRENNVVRVDFGREADPPVPKFPGANGLRPVKKEVASIGPAIPFCGAGFHRVTYQKLSNAYHLRRTL
jgi:hypothetical protein